MRCQEPVPVGLGPKWTVAGVRNLETKAPEAVDETRVHEPGALSCEEECDLSAAHMKTD